MKILGFDTSTKFLSLAVQDGDKVLSRLHDDIGMRHSSVLVESVDRVLKEARLEMRDLDAIALGLGPGSFTGLRIGLAFAKAVNLALGTKLAGIPSLDAVAQNFVTLSQPYIAPLLDARKEKVYSAFYQRAGGTLKRTSRYLLEDIDMVLKRVKKETLFCGDAVVVYGEILKDHPRVRVSENNDWYPRGDVIARLGALKISREHEDDPKDLVPMYLHAKECNVRKAGVANGKF